MDDKRRFGAELAEQRGFVEALARKLVLDPDAVDDVVQETLLAAMNDPPRKSLRGWLARVVRNLAYRSLRTEERRRRREHRAARPATAPATADLVARVTWHRTVVDTLLALGEPYRTTLLLRFFEDLTPKEIAERLGVPAPTVRTRLRRGLERMRERLDKEHGGDRRAWSLALLPLAFARPSTAAVSAPAAGAATGVALMTSKQKLALAVVLLIAALAGTAWVLRGGEAADGSPTARTPLRGERPGPATAEALETEVAAPSGKALVVIVEDPSGAPLAGARVEVRETVSHLGGLVPEDHRWRSWLLQGRGPRTLAGATTDAAGTATLEGVSGPVFVVARKPGYAPASRSTHPQDEPVRLRVRRGYPLAGVLRDDSGTPVAGAVVLAGRASLFRSGVSDGAQRVVADAGGGYRFAALIGEELSLWAGLPGGVPRFVATLRFPGLDRLDVVLERGGIVAGTVTEEGTGRPLADVEVFLRDRRTHAGHFGHAVTDAAGRYSVDTMPPCVVNGVTVIRSGYAQVYSPERFEVECRPGATAVLDARMHRGGVVIGRIVSRGQPVPGAHVTSGFRRPDGGGSIIRNVRTDDRGGFVLDSLPAGKHGIAVWPSGGYRMSKGWVSPFQLLRKSEDEPNVVVLAPGGTVEVQIELEQGTVTVEGVVLGPDGEPFGGAGVWWTTTDEHGRFVAERVFAGHALVARAPGLQSGSFKVPDGATRLTGIVLRLAPKVRMVVSGTVRTRDGHVPADAQVRFANTSDRFMGRLLAWQNGWRVPVAPDGTHEFELPGRHTYEVGAEAPGLVPSERVLLELEPDRDRYRLDFVLDTGHTLTGRVRGERAGGVSILARRPLEWGDASRLVSQGLVHAGPMVAQTDAEGGFTARGLGPGRWEVVALAPWAAPAAKEVYLPQEGALVFDLVPRVVLGGTVAYEDGTPVAGASVSASPLDANGRARVGEGHDTRTDADGRWSFARVDPGSYRLYVRGSPEANLVRETHERVVAGGQDVRIVVRPGRTISGRIVDRAGNGVAGVSVSASAKDRGHASAYTATDGSFVLRWLPEGAYALGLAANNRRLRVGEEVAAGATGVRVVFDPTRDDLGRDDVVSATGILRDEQGRPVAGHRLSLKRVDGLRETRSHVAWTERDGVFVFDTLARTRYRVVLGRDFQPGAVHYLAELGEISGGDVAAELVARRGLSISGSVVGPGGEPLAGVIVLGRPRDGGPFAFGTTGADGRFEMCGFAAGLRCRVEARRDGLVRTTIPDVEAGTADLTIRLRHGLAAQGVLRDAGGPRPKTSLRFAWAEDETHHAWTTTDAQGRFAVRELLPGRHRVEARIGSAYVVCGWIDAGASNLDLRVPE